MKTLRERLAEDTGRERDAVSGPGAEARAGGAGSRPGWGELLKTLLMVHVARSAQEVVSRAPRVREAGRKGGMAGAAVSPRAYRDVPAAPGPARAASADAGAGEGVPNGVGAILKTTFTEFGKDNGTLLAAAVAFYLLLSLVPLVLVGIAIFGYVVGDTQAYKQVLAFTRDFFPAQADMLAGVVDSVRKAREEIGLAGLATLLFTATGGFATLETAINTTWGAPNRSFIMNKLFALGMLVLIGALLVLSIGLSTVVGWAGAIPGLQWLEYNWAAKAVGHVLSILIGGVMFTFIYKFFPNTRVEWKPALISGFVTAVLWGLFKVGYLLYTGSSFGNQEAAYGSLAGFIGLIVWISYSCTLILMGSELTWVLNGRPAPCKPKEIEGKKDRMDAAAA